MSDHPEGTRPFTPAQMATLRKMAAHPEKYHRVFASKLRSAECLIKRGVVR